MQTVVTITPKYACPHSPKLSDNRWNSQQIPSTVNKAFFPKAGGQSPTPPTFMAQILLIKENSAVLLPYITTTTHVQGSCSSSCFYCSSGQQPSSQPDNLLFVAVFISRETERGLKWCLNACDYTRFDFKCTGLIMHKSEKKNICGHNRLRETFPYSYLASAPTGEL